MYIEKLVLDNFKSFGRKTEIPFYEDFTTISGPNGSGKSNIIDAILFCLGLSRSSRIRAEKLTDLIYNPGTESSSPPPNEATVEVILNNTDRSLSDEQLTSILESDRIGDYLDNWERLIISHILYNQSSLLPKVNQTRAPILPIILSN